MDPDANWEEQLELAEKMAGDGEYPLVNYVEEFEADATRLAELVLALNEWIQKGGFLPKKWEQKK